MKYKETKIRPLVMDDLDNIMTWVNDREVVGNYAYFTAPFTREQESKWIEEKINSKVDFFFAIENEEGVYLGNIAIEKVHWPAKHGQLSITIGNRKERGKGHGYRAVNLVLDQAFNQYKLHKVYLFVSKENKIARSLYHKCGFVDEGELREHYIIDGEYVNMYFMSIMEDEFRKIYNTN